MKHPELPIGSRGGFVRALQQLVSQAEHAKPGLARDGIFGPLTRAAMTRFQGRQGLAADGIVGPHTWTALGSSLRLPQLAESAPKSTAHAAPSPRPLAAPVASVPARPAVAAVPRPAPAPPATPAPRTHVSRSPAAAPEAPPGPADQVGGPDEPKWYQVGLAEFNAHHTIFNVGDGNQRIHEYFGATNYHPAVGQRESWCSAFANWCMKEAGLRGTNDPAAASWLHWGVELETPRLGCIMVIHWAKHSKHSSGNHVTFYESQTAGSVKYFGGNQGNRSQISHSSAVRSLITSTHYRWPSDSL